MKRALELVNAVILLLMLLITLSQILFRSVLRISASWSEELAMYTFACIVFVGAVSLTADDSHITITALTDRLSAGLQKWLRILGRLVTVPFMVLFTWGAFQNMQNTIATSLPTAEWMKIGYMYLVLFVAGALMIWYLAANTVRDIMRRTPKSTVKEGTL